MRFLIVDDHPILRLGVRQLIAAAWPEAQIDEAATIDAAVAAFAAHPADAIVLDLALPDAAGVEGPARMLRIAPGRADPGVEPARRVGLRGAAAADGAWPATCRRSAPATSSSPHCVACSMAAVTSPPRWPITLLGLLDGKNPDALPHERLSAQEYRVMQLIAAGRGASEIAETMQLSVKTVSSYRARILTKAGWANNTELTKYCVQHGLTDPD